MTLPLAHLGHWYFMAPLYAAPVLIIVWSLVAQTLRQRRSARHPRVPPRPRG